LSELFIIILEFLKQIYTKWRINKKQMLRAIKAGTKVRLPRIKVDQKLEGIKESKMQVLLAWGIQIRKEEMVAQNQVKVQLRKVGKSILI